jgi:gliding motility-associated-like protein
MLAVSLYGNSSIEIFDFDNESGAVSAAKISPPDYQGAYGLEFSPDNTKLYLSTLDNVNFIPAFPSILYQFDLTSADIFADPRVIYTSTNAFRFGSLQLGIDGRIYMAKSINATSHSDDLSVIYNPNRPDTLCNFDKLGGTEGMVFGLGGKQSYWGLPNVVQSFVDWPHFTYDSVCDGDVTIFRLNNEANVDDASWDFKDPSGTSNTVDFLNPTHMFSEVGQYQVEVTETYGGQNFTYAESVTVYPLPEPEFGYDTIYIFKGDNARLNVGEWSAYNWSTGATTQDIIVSEPGTYWVEVQNGQCCWNADTIEVVYYNLYMPNAFRPSSAINNEFKPVVTFNALQDYRLQIYDRWGQLIFESRDIGTGWKGEINNEAAPLGVYAWRIDYQTVSDEGTRTVTMAGTVMLLR